MEINEVLKNIGLSEKEILLYIALLKLGKGSAYAIAKKSGLKKPTTYVVLEKLEQRGLVSRLQKTKKQIFVPKSPGDFFTAVENKIQLARTVLPQLRAFATGGKEKLKILFFEGVSGIREILNYRLDDMTQGEFIGIYTDTKGLSTELLNIFQEYNKRLTKLEIQVKAIIPINPKAKKYKEQEKDYDGLIKFIPNSEYNSKITFEVGSTFVRILSFQNLQGIIIEDKEIANALRQFFELIFNYSQNN